MGSNLSRLKKYVEKGDETKALEIYYRSSDVRRKLNANSIVNDLTLDTFMHLSAMHGMVEFLKLLLKENNGNPNKTNRNDQTVLHKCCQGAKDSVQYECIKLLLQWREANHDKLNTTTTNKNNTNIIDIESSNTLKQNQNLFTEINVNAKDKFENTPLHYAAMRNLPSCVQTLFTHGAYLFIENAEHSTPCDLAERYGQKDIALFLESKMIFSKEVDEIDTENDPEQVIIIEEKPNYGLRIKDLKEEKDKLLIETSEILRCSIFTAEIMLKKHEWSKEKLLNSWIEDPIKCCEKCGISCAAIDQKNDLITDNNNIITNRIFKFDSDRVIARKLSGRYHIKKRESISKMIIENNHQNNLVSQIIETESRKSDSNENMNNSDLNLFKEINNNNINYKNETRINSNKLNEANCLNCEICYCSFDTTSPEQTNHTSLFVEIICGHKFCKTCWEQYLTIKIEEGNVSDIVCPQVDCYAILPHSTIQSLVSKEIAEKYLQFDLKAFVDSNPTIKWCPFPGCGMAVKNPNLNRDNNQTNESTNEQNNIKEYLSTVDCGNGHYFCWECLQEAHEPSTCKNWKDWYQKILEIKPEELNNTAENEALSANYLWLVTNSKKCPNTNCNAPIQKNEGCNHVKCYKCKHDFCWICLESWKKHSSVTGGYFQCNRYEASTKILQKQSDTIAKAEDTHLKAVELNKFIHYYTRFKNHEHSYKIEEPLLAMAKTKFEMLIAQNSMTELRNERTSTPDLIQEESQTKTINIESIDPIEETNTKLNSDTNKTKQNSNESHSHLFIEEAIRELLKARKILRCSYVYGYYLDTFGHKKFIFEFIQTEFEECTENLSQIIARPHLKTPKHKIVKLTNVLRKKRIEFLDTITRGLNSFNDTPPALKKYSRQRWKYLLKDNIQNDDEFKNTIALSLKELNPKNPWIIDRKGRHTNLMALLNDWPELEQELDSILIPSKEKKALCAKWDCGNVRAVNSLSGSLCNYCSIRCMRSDRNSYLEDKNLSTDPSSSTSSIHNTNCSLQTDNFKSKLKDQVVTNSFTANTSKSILTESFLKKFNKNKSNNSSSSSSNNSITKNDCEKLKTAINNGSTKMKSSYFNRLGYDYEHDFDMDPDTDLISAIEVSKLQYFIDISKKDSKLENDTQKAIELSLKSIDKEDVDSNGSVATTSSSTSKLNDSSNNNSLTNASVLNQIHLNSNITNQHNDNITDLTNDTTKLVTSKNKPTTTMISYDTLFLNACNENEISVLIKNMDKIYDNLDQDSKVNKVCNFKVKSNK